MGKQQSVLEQLEAEIAELKGTAPIVDEPTPAPTPNVPDDFSNDAARQTEIDKIDNMSSEELSAYIDSLPGGKTKSDKPLPDMASSGRPVQAFEKGALALSGVKLSDDKVKKLKEEGLIALGDNAPIMSRFQNIFGTASVNDFKDEKNPQEAFEEYKKLIENNGKYYEGILNPAALKQMSTYGGNEDLKKDFLNAYNLTNEFSNELQTADLLKNELDPYIKGEKQAKSQEQLNDLNAKLKEYDRLKESLMSKMTDQKNEKGETVPSAMNTALQNIKGQNTWEYGSITDDQFGFDEMTGSIVTGKEWKKNSEGLIVVNDIKTDAGAREKDAAYKSIINIDDEFNTHYTQKVEPIYESFLSNAVKKLDSKNPDTQRGAFDMLMGALAGTEVMPFPKRTLDRIRRSGTYDDQLTALKELYNMPINQDGTVLQNMIKRTNGLNKSQFVLNYAKTDFGQNAGNYPTTFDENIKSQADWQNFAANGELKQLQQDKKEWNGSSLKIKKLMDAYINNSDDLKNIMEKAISESKKDFEGGAAKDSRKIETSLNNAEGKKLLLDASQQMTDKNGRIVPFNTWMRSLVNQDNNDKLGGDKFSRLFGATAFDWATNNGTFTIYVNDEGKTIRANPFNNDEPMTTPPKDYKPLTLHTVTIASNGVKPKISTGSGGRTGINPEYYMATNNATNAIERAKKFYDQMSGRIKEEYNDLNVAYANNTTVKLSGLGNYGSRGLMQYGLDLRMVKNGKGASILNTKARDSKSPFKDQDDISEIKDLGYEDPRLRVTNKHKNIQDGIFKLIAPNGKFMDYNDPSYVDPITNVSNSFRNHAAQNKDQIITVTDSWDNNAMTGGEMWTNRNMANNKELLEGFFQQGDKESNKDYEKRMGDVTMTSRRIGMEKNKATYQFTDGNGKSLFVNIPYKGLEKTEENFYKYTGKSAGEKEFEITGKELLPMPKLQNGDNAFDEPLYLQVDDKGNYVVNVSYTDSKGEDVNFNIPTQLPQQITPLPQARELTRKLIENVVNQRIQPINQ